MDRLLLSEYSSQRGEAVHKVCHTNDQKVFSKVQIHIFEPISKQSGLMGECLLSVFGGF